MQVRADGDRAPFVGGIDEAVETLGGIEAHRQEPNVIDLRRCRHSLSYAPATWFAVERRSQSCWRIDGTCQITVALRNDAARATTEAVPVYLRDLVAEVADPTATRCCSR